MQYILISIKKCIIALCCVVYHRFLMTMITCLLPCEPLNHLFVSQENISNWMVESYLIWILNQCKMYFLFLFFSESFVIIFCPWFFRSDENGSSYGWCCWWNYQSSGADCEALQPLELWQRPGFNLNLVFIRFSCLLYCSVPFNSSVVISFFHIIISLWQTL